MRSVIAGLVLLVLAAPAGATDAIEVREDFGSASIPAGWTVSSAAWRVADGALRGAGDGSLQFDQAIAGDFDLSFEARVSEKANVEVHLVDAATGAPRIAFAFLGRYHGVLKGVKASLLVDEHFVSVMPQMWIWPGRTFAFRARRAGRDCAMFLDGAAGPACSADTAAGPLRVRIVVSCESPSASVSIDSIRLAATKAASGASPPPAAAPPPGSSDPAAAPVLETARTKNIVFHNHADASFVAATIAGELQRQHDWLREWVGTAPETVVVHAGIDYPFGFARPTAAAPEMFLRAGTIFDSQADYAHEMTHCFLFRYGQIPHWFNESMSDMAYVDAEIGLWRRRTEAFLRAFDRAEHRSYELAKLRMRFGKDYFPKVCRLLEKNRETCRATFKDGVPLAQKNELLLAILSEAAGEDLRPWFRDAMGFDAKTRERQRGY